MRVYKIVFVGCVLSAMAVPGHAQDSAPSASNTSASNEANSLEATESERWNLFYQATAIGDYHGTFTAPYRGPLSLEDNPERDVSITTTLFFTARLERDTFLVFNPEIAGGKGFSGVTGLGNQPHGEIPRVASATPKP